MQIASICVFCGSSPGNRSAYASAAEAVGRTLAQRGIRLVFGGGRIGLMGMVADAALGAGGEVVGVIPQHLVDWELAHQGLTKLHVVNSMHERKALMAELADGFITLPGGSGTLDEFCEILTWSQLGLNPKAVGLLNVENYFDPLLAVFDNGVREGFIRAEHRRLILVSQDVEELLALMTTHEPGTTDYRYELT